MATVKLTIRLFAQVLSASVPVRKSGVIKRGYFGSQQGDSTQSYQGYGEERQRSRGPKGAELLYPNYETGHWRAPRGI